MSIQSKNQVKSEERSMVLIFITLKGFITTLNIGIKLHNTSTRTNMPKLRFHFVQNDTTVQYNKRKSTQQHTAHHIDGHALSVKNTGILNSMA